MKTIYRLLFLSIIGIFLFSCSDDDENGLSGTPMQLTASVDTLELIEANENDVALTFTWNKGLDRPAYDTVSYIFRLNIATGDFDKTSTPPDTIDDFTKSYTTLELNDLLTEKWNVFPGEEAVLDARVVAKVDGPKFVYPEIAYSSIVVKTYAPKSRPLYVVGTATDGGNDPGKSDKIEEVFNGKLYHWEGNLKVGKFKFLTTQSAMLPSFNKGKDNNTLVERNSESEPDNSFDIDRDGYYGISLFRKEMRIEYKYIPYPNIYLIGNAGTGWDLPGNMHKFKMDPERPNVFTLTIELSGGEFKFLTAADWGTYTFRPMEADGPISNDGVQVYAGGDDLKWRVKDDEAGNYKITLDVNSMKIKFEKL